ncbi:hypothetical protein XENTR_v10005711 [Xenopus tropicalis]|nr:hypothetical protein XENTR_v10005711 [Xenopus tropicalis]
MSLFQSNMMHTVASLVLILFFINILQEQKKTKWIGEIWKKYKLLIKIIGIFLLLVLVAIISLVAYTKHYVDEDEYPDVALNMEKSMYTFTGSLTIKDSCVLDTLGINKETLQQRVRYLCLFCWYYLWAYQKTDYTIIILLYYTMIILLL